MTEAELKRIVVQMARSRGWLVHETPQIKPRRPVKSDPGYPDLTLAREGHATLWIELKQEGGRLTDDQASWRSLLDTEVIRPSDIASGRLGELLK